ncbi:MAG TPA: alpha/beta hydrolase [Lentisphaeria bacterium]|nr:MAG: alpha/beta hydrolase [Lentisphaerae bacterium GWF2_50_93]HCE45921.1 alpha/beta hydrolase [Lentisphaeria bacterium]
MDVSMIKDIYPFKHHYFKIKSYNMHYIDEGLGEPLVILHGNPSWSFLFRNLIPELSRTNRVIVPDHLGCGMSDKPQNFQYRLETHIDNLEEFLLGLDLQNINLMVHDWGGPIGLGFAIRYPERIKRLIITNTAAFTSTKIPFRISVCRTPWLGEKLVRSLNLFCKMSLRMTTVRKMPENVKKGFILPYDSYENRIAVYNFVKDIPVVPEAPSYEVLVGIEHGLWMFKDHPVAIAWGMKDWCFHEAFLKKWKQVYPQASVLPLYSAGHYLFEDEPAKITEFVKKFISN